MLIGFPMPKVLPVPLSLLLAAMLCASAPMSVAADARPAVLPVDYFYKTADMGTAVLSPNGRYLATTMRKKGMLQLAVLDLETNEAKMVAGYSDFEITGVTWLNDERIVYSVVDRSVITNEPGGLYTVARTGGKSTVLVPTWRDQKHPLVDTDIIAMHPVRLARDGSGKLLAIGHIRDGFDARPLLVDLGTGRHKEIDFNLAGKAIGLLFDGRDQVRVATMTTGEDLQTTQLWYRDASPGPWRMLTSHQLFEDAVTPAALVGDTLYVTAPAGAHRGLYKYDTVNNKLGELVLADPEVDVTGALVLAPDRAAVLGVRLGTERPRTHWFDSAYAALQNGIDRAHPNHVNDIFPNHGDAARLIKSYSSTDPGRVLRYDPATKKLAHLFRLRPWVEPEKMSEKLGFEYKARDGLPITGYLTLPKGRDPKKLPLIVYPHGGPHVRDEFGFDENVQFLANRGYVVLQPQFRGSSGFGLAHMKKGFRQWGLAMQDDITDGVKALVDDGMVDPQRVCIMGYSYGGYAAMMGLVKDPDQYKCGINLVGVTDLTALLKNGRWSTEGFRNITKIGIGDLATMKEQLARTSPVNRAADIKAPVFMAYGEKDSRVPLAQGTDMRDALKKAGKPVEWMSFANEEHSFVQDENRFRMANGIDAFLKKYNPAD